MTPNDHEQVTSTEITLYMMAEVCTEVMGMTIGKEKRNVEDSASCCRFTQACHRSAKPLEEWPDKEAFFEIHAQGSSGT